MARRPLPASEALAVGLTAMALGGGLLLWTATPPGLGVDGSDPNAAVARKVVEAVRTERWGLAGMGHRWDEAKAAGSVEVQASKESSSGKGSTERRATAVMKVSAVRSAVGDGVAEAARQALGGEREASGPMVVRKVRAELVQKCRADGDCGDMRVASVRFEGGLASRLQGKDGLAEKGKEALERAMGGGRR